MFWIFLLLLVNGGNGCHPECRYECNDPVCEAECTSVFKPLNCRVQCTGNYTGNCRYACDILQPPNECESEHCPAAEIVCTELHCLGLPGGITCEVLCDALQGSWKCTKPSEQNCPLPECELMCDAPACAYSSLGTISIASIFIILFILAINYGT